MLFRRILQNKTELFHYESTGKLFDCPKIVKIDTAATLAFLQNLFIDIVQMLLRVPSVDVSIALVTSALVIAVTKYEREGFVRIS